MFGWDPERIVVENQLVGGGFGGKEDVSVQHLAALAAWHLKRPVKVKLSRHESICFHPKRHAMKADFTLGCDENGIFTGLDCEIYFDTGAYASLCGPVLERACTHAVGPYCYQNTDIRGYGYYTNNPPAGAFRGFGVSQSEFALEMVINALARKASLSPWEIRWRNAIEPGKILPNGQIADLSTALKEALEAVRPFYEANMERAGIACAMKNAGVGVGLMDDGNALLKIENGTVVIYTCASDIGQGGYTVFAQDAAEATGLPKACIRMGISSTENAPDSGTTSGSRQTLVTGEAVRGAAFLLRDAMTAAGMAAERKIREGRSAQELTAEELREDVLQLLRTSPGCTAPRSADNERAAYGTGLSFAPGQAPGPFVSPNLFFDDAGRICGKGSGLDQGTYGSHGTQTLIQGSPVEDPAWILSLLEGLSFSYRYFEPTDPLGADVPNPKSHIAYGYAACCAILDEAGKVTDIYSAYDAGKVVNPISIQGQIEGGVLMGMGYACTEDFPLKECIPDVKFGKLGLLRAPQIPDVHALYVEKEELLGVSYGSKGIGEITSIPAAPAIAGAYYALDHELRTKLPMEHTYYHP
jgi:CO/xanthine dehydrogenase Mo-binding subunit